jgi:hypothetical protein
VFAGPQLQAHLTTDYQPIVKRQPGIEISTSPCQYPLPQKSPFLLRCNEKGGLECCGTDSGDGGMPTSQ